MSGHTEATATADLKKQWRKWTKVVAGFARRRVARVLVSEESFAALRKELLAACEFLAAWAEEEPRRAFYERLDGLVRPWAKLEALARAEREILFDLLHRCQEAEQDLYGIKRRPHDPVRGAALVGILALSLGVFVGVLAVTQGWLPRGLWAELRGASDDLAVWTRQVSSTIWLVLVGVGMILLSMLIVSRVSQR
jgi:hypothetical protein